MAQLAPSLQPGGLNAAAAARRLYLLFRIGGDRYALDAGEVIEVLGLRVLKQVPGAPSWVAGMLHWRGRPVPVIDMSALAGQDAAARVTSTRLAMVHYRADAAEQVLGLILEQATETVHYDPTAFQPAGLDNPDARYLGPVLNDAHGMVQAVGVNDLLAPPVRAMLYPASHAREVRP